MSSRASSSSVGWLVAAAALATACATDREDCERHSAAGRWRKAVKTCAAAYRASGDDGDGDRLAQAYVESDRLEDALAIARGLRSDLYGKYVLARILQDRRPIEALLYASLAMGDAVASWQPAWIAQAAYLQAGAAKGLGKFALAEDALGLAVALGGDYAQLGRVNLLRAAGDYEEARRLGQQATERAKGDAAGHAEASLQLGLVYSDSDGFALAKVHLRRAIDETERPDQIASAAMNLAFVESELGRCPAALAYLQLAGMTESREFDWLLLAGRVALRCDDRDRAARWLHAARGLPHDGQWRWQVPDLLGALAERDGDAALAEREYLASIAEVEQMRRDGGRLEAIVAGKLVEPYEHAIGLAAGRGDWRTALGLILRYEQGAAGGVAIDATIAAWHGRRLAILVRGRDRIWRIDLGGGGLQGAAVGAVRRLGDIDLLRDEPDARAIAETLGGALAASPGAGPLDVMLIGDLAEVPLAALRDGPERIIAHTALVRALRITPDPRPRSTGTAPIVIGDPGGDLPGARSEAEWVGHMLGVAPHLGASADRVTLATARGAGVLHVAAHATWTLDGPSLPFADGAVTAADLAALAPAPRLVVLASCFSARARDRSGWTSLASGFLDAGAELVISTQTSVDDAAARRLVESFYRHGGVAAPADALRRAQLELDAAGVDAHEWASFIAIAGPPVGGR